MKFLLLVPIAAFIVAAVSCAGFSSGGGEKTQIVSPQVYAVKAPVAGDYPQGLFKYPYRAISLNDELFTQTLEWGPAVPKTFAPDTRYTARLTLTPAGKQHTFIDVPLESVSGLPSDGVEGMSAVVEGDKMVITIEFAKTAVEKAEPQLIFSDEFEGNELDRTKWDLCPEWDRQGRSSWQDDMVSVGGGLLHLKFRVDAELGRNRTSNRTLADSWIRAGGIRSRAKDGRILFDNSYGYYEARIKFPKVDGTWGAFWLMSPTQHITADEGVDGTEIDIVESIHNKDGKYNAALHWNGYGTGHKSTGSNTTTKPVVDIYDGEFHVFALDWSPSEYVFYVDGKVFWRVDGGSECGINQNPNYIKLTVESADWAGAIPRAFPGDEMLVDYVRVYSRPMN
jgi:beta-glucanase (GH16 family)